jgi:integrase
LKLIKAHEENDEILVYDQAVVYKRGDYWQFRMWLRAENKYARKSLGTKNRLIAIEKAKDYYLEIMSNIKLGKTYFSLTAKEGVEIYLANKEKEIGTNIKAGRYGTIKTHLAHWLNFIARDTKLKDLHRMNCENYYLERNKNKKKVPVKSITLKQEMSTINTMMKWLHKHNHTLIDEFEFKKLKRIDKRDETLRRNTFYSFEVETIEECLVDYCDKEKNNLEHKEWLTRLCVSYYLMIASMTGLRTGEQKQLKWGDLIFSSAKINGKEVSLINITVRAETSKVGQTRSFYCLDKGYFKKWHKVVLEHSYTNHTNKHLPISTKDFLVFSLDGKTELTQRATLYHFDKLLELAEIDKDLNGGGIKRDLVPYSFRHFFITQKIEAGMNFHEIADICGTSTTYIENTYYHPDAQKQKAKATVGYDVDDDGNVRFE